MTDKRPTRNAFVIMPFDSELNEVYSEFLKPALEQIGFHVARADDVMNQQNILRNIVESIAKAELVVADLTALNPNVFYELGIAHALRRRVVLLTQDIEEIPFDLRSYRIVVYDTHFSRIQKARDALSAVAQGAFEETLEFGNPVTDFLSVAATGGDQSFADLTVDLPPAGSSIEGDKNADEKGWLDYVDGLHSGFEQLTQVLAEITASTELIGNTTTKSTQRLDEIRRAGGNKTHTLARMLASEYGKQLLKYAESLQKGNDDYERISEDVHNGIEYVVAHGDLSDPEAAEKLRGLLTVLDGMVEAAVGARENYVSMRDVTIGLRGIEMQMTRAAKAASQQIDRLVSNVDKTIASAQRAAEVGRGRLSNL